MHLTFCGGDTTNVASGWITEQTIQQFPQSIVDISQLLKEPFTRVLIIL